MKLLRHPLRDTLTKKDLKRIHTALETEDIHSVSTEELDAVNDILYDAITSKNQTHLGVTILQ
jgi:hypothetical protein